MALQDPEEAVFGDETVVATFFMHYFVVLRRLTCN